MKWFPHDLQILPSPLVLLLPAQDVIIASPSFFPICSDHCRLQALGRDFIAHLWMVPWTSAGLPASHSFAMCCQCTLPSFWGLQMDLIPTTYLDSVRALLLFYFLPIAYSLCRACGISWYNICNCTIFCLCLLLKHINFS